MYRGGKWGVPAKIFSPHFYPPYCYGLGIVLAPGLASLLLHIVKPIGWIAQFPNDDALFIGIASANLGLQMRSVFVFTYFTCIRNDLNYFDVRINRCTLFYRSFEDVMMTSLNANEIPSKIVFAELKFDADVNCTSVLSQAWLRWINKFG